jgi:hypothetical protein
MRPKLERTLFGAAAALSLSLVAPAMAADHRDAPTIDDYSAIDINDVFMFRDPGDSSKLVVALSTQAVADPQFGSSYHFQANALYRLDFATRREPHPTANIDFVFGPFGNGAACPAPAPACQTFRAFFSQGMVVDGFTTQGTSGGTHLTPVITTAGDIKVFAGPREDPFFFDLVGFNRSIAAGANKFTGVDAFLGKNVNAIVIELPVNMLFPAGSCIAPNSQPFSTPCGVWAVTYLGTDDLGDSRTDDTENLEARPDGLRQVDRMGNPAVNTALIPAALKDSFNFGQPKTDRRDFARVILNQILTLDQKFGTCPSTETNVFNCNPNVPLLASVAVPDILRFASNVADGYPNGRQLADPTLDILIGLILQIPGFTDGTQPRPIARNSRSSARRFS